MDLMEVRKILNEVKHSSKTSPFIERVAAIQTVVLQTEFDHNSPVFHMNMKMVERMEEHESKLADVLAERFRCRGAVINWGAYVGSSVSFWGHKEDLTVLAELYNSTLKHMEFAATAHLIREGKKANADNSMIYKKGLRQKFYEEYLSQLSEQLVNDDITVSAKVLKEYMKARLIREDEYPEHIQKLDAIVRRNTGIEFVTFAGFHEKVAKEAAVQMIKMAKMFPKVTEKRVQWFSTCQIMNRRYEELYHKTRVKGSTWAFARSDRNCPEMNGIGFNMRWASDYNKFMWSIKHSHQTGYHPEHCDSIASVVSHEFGHQVDEFLTRFYPHVRRKIVDENWQRFRKYEWRTMLDSEGRPRLDKRGRERRYKVEVFMCKDLSRYALENDKEMFAEAFAEWVHSGFNPRSEIARTIGNQLAEHFNLDVRTLSATA